MRLRCTAQTLQLGCYPGEGGQACRMNGYGGGGGGGGGLEGAKGEEKGRWGGRKGVFSGVRGEHCSRLGRDERACLCHSLIPPFGK